MVKCHEAPKTQHPFVLVAWPFLRDREQASPSTFTRLCAIWSCFGLRRTRCVPLPRLWLVNAGLSASISLLWHLVALRRRRGESHPVPYQPAVH